MESATLQRKRASKMTDGSASPAATASTTTSSVRSEELDYDSNFDDDDDDDDLDAFLSDEDLRAAVAADKERYSELRRKQKRRKQRLAAGRLGSLSWLLQSLAAGCNSLRSASALARVLLGASFVWLFAALLWLRWPIYIQMIAEPMTKALGDKHKAEVEPRVVVATLALPFAVSGALFYWLEPNAASATSSSTRASSKWLEWLRRQRRAFLSNSIDSTDAVAIVVFGVVQLNCFVGKLLIDQYTGKLAKAGLLARSARTFGMNGLYAMILSIVLVSRQSFVLQYLRVSSERASKYHVWSSNAAVLFLLLHGVLYTIYWLERNELQTKLLPCLGATCSATETYKTTRNFAGVVALALLLVVALMSLERVRRRHFRRFALAHIVNGLVVATTCVHYYPAVFWLAPSVLVYVLYRVVARAGQGSASVISATSLNDKIVQLELRRDPSGNDFRPGQFVYLKVDAISRYAWHPFSIRSSPLRNRFALHVDAKVHGAFTRALLAHIKSRQLTTVHVDGYYGAPIALHTHTVLVAGGSGMTPFLSALEHLQLQSEQLQASGGGSGSDLTVPTTLWIIWTCRDVELLEAHAALLLAVSKSTRWRTTIWLHVTPTVADNEVYEGDRDDISDDDDSDNARVVTFFPVATHRYAYARDAALAQPFATFVGACVGMALAMYGVYTAAPDSAVGQRWWCQRVLLLAASVSGAAAGSAVVLAVRHALSRRTQDSGVGSVVTELECMDLDLSSPVTPQTPRKHVAGGNDSSASLLHRSFSVVPSRPDVQQRLRSIHSEIQESFGLSADVALFVSGPASLQTDVKRHASALHSPLVAVHIKSFTV